ncbi:helix-hairpin-helix domain-containing protein [Streptomyces griseorubiginosus]|uniref:helix-hairpin-helix domain-containing protein n=1 Tax=Streptomyces griseorubiginosus TaxID=67304 RepID=UPI002E81DB39|nr:helix-hairpin-helix domain-containing protein [Streptomyces griseorubiginosus]WUB48247.1 DNA helicase RecD [Streptomyces griseorubiginosus]WUB56772.1 DNA helicase RecD [Streptomyces griseorubiginosus]
MSTEPEPTENTDPETRVAAPEPEPEPAPQGADAARGAEADAEGAGADAAGEAAEATGSEGTEGDGADKAQLSEAEAELAAQRVERERIARRKAEKQGPVEAGAKLSGKAADLLAAVRAVESGAKPVAAVFSEPEPPRRPAQEAARSRPVSAASRAGDGVGVGGAIGVVASPGGGVSPPGPGPEAVEAVRRVLAEGGAPEGLAPQVAAVLGEGADAELRADPWQLLRVAGVRPEQADGFARALLGAECAPDDERRGRAVTVWLLEQAALAGHTALEMPALTAALAQRGVPDTDAAVQSTIAEAEALVFQDALDPTAPEPAHPVEGAEDDEEGAERPVRILVGLERYALAEESLADGLARLINSVPKEDGSAEDWERAAASAKGSAAELIRATATHGLVLHTGGEASLAEPAALLEAARSLGLRAWAATHSPLGRDRFGTLLGAGRQGAAASQGAAHPGDARPHPGDARPHPGPGRPEDAAPPERTTQDQPAADSPARPVATVAGLLSGAEGPGRDGDGAFDLDVLVVLDAPQLDVETAALLVESLPDGARLVLAGDPAVLWSAGPGRVFADLLAARICPQVASRTPDPGPLGELVSGIGIGELNKVEAPGKEVVIVPVRDAGEAVHRTVQLVADSVPRAIGVPAEQTQVITPGHGGAAGTRVLNAALKERLNPGPGRFGGFDPGDRVAYSPTPGRTIPGHVVGADAEGLRLTCGGEDVVVPKERVEQSVRHGWALTAHQAVGGRWPAVVAVLPGDAAQALTRPWVYTAFGSASRHLSVVHGADQALPRAVAEIPAKPRTTRLPTLLATPTAT